MRTGQLLGIPFEISNRAFEIGLPPRVEVDQDERPAIEQTDLGDDRTL
jgi:hypothetical protein